MGIFLLDWKSLAVTPWKVVLLSDAWNRLKRLTFNKVSGFLPQNQVGIFLKQLQVLELNTHTTIHATMHK